MRIGTIGTGVIVRHILKGVRTHGRDMLRSGVFQKRRDGKKAGR